VFPTYAANECLPNTEKDSVAELMGTTSWGYLRLLREQYKGAEFTPSSAQAEQQGCESVVAFFRHEDAAAGREFSETVNIVLKPQLTRC